MPTRSSASGASLNARRSRVTPVILRNGFRPFFLAAALWAAIAVPIWLTIAEGMFSWPSGFDGLDWHRHEMLFGFAAAGMAGFILTAIPNWTGRLPVRGWSLCGVVGLWLVGRIGYAATSFVGPGPAAAADLAFPAVLSAMVLREILAGRNFRNLPIAGALTLFTTGNVLIHVEAVGFAQTADIGYRMSLYILMLMVALIGGRVVPSFTRNWLAKHNRAASLAAQGRLDHVALGALACYAIAAIAGADERMTASLALCAAGLHAARLYRWQGWRTVSEPLLFILHVGYGWLVTALLLAGISGLTEWVSASSALHAMTVGAFGTMIAAIMTRATLGHTGRSLSATRGTVAIYLLIMAAALSRVASPFVDTLGPTLLILSGLFWSTGFAIFALHYGPMLCRPSNNTPN